MLPMTGSVKTTEFGKAISNRAEVTQKAFDHISASRRIGIPTGTSFNSFSVSFVRVETSGVPITGLPRSERIVLQHVSISSFAVPMARLGSASMEDSIYFPPGVLRH